MNKNLHIKSSAEESFGDNDMEQKIMNFSANLKVPFTSTNEEAFERLQAKISTGAKVIDISKGRKVSIMYYIATAAAVVLALLGVWQFVLRSPMKDVVADKGQHAEYQLPDGSRVSLNAESKISFQKSKFSKDRNLSMEGEAFFSVKKGSTFTINTNYADIKILGTSFNVYSRENRFKVSCVTGKIEVSSGEQSVIIHPGECAYIENNVLVKDIEKNIETVANWRNGEFTYENTPLNLVLSEIERQFNITFVFSNANERYYNGGFNSSNLIDALEAVCGPMGLTYEIKKNSQIFIYDKK
jgi:ferric-dicitrate binding protein FerR (iron transport regulator)